MNTQSFYLGREVYEQHLISALTPLSCAQLAFCLPPHWSIGRIAAHIVVARGWWFHSRAGERTDDLTPLEYWDARYAPVRSAAELVVGLETTWLMTESDLSRTE